MQRRRPPSREDSSGWIESPVADERVSLIQRSPQSPQSRPRSQSFAGLSLSSCWAHRQLDYCDISPAADRAARDLSSVLGEPLGPPGNPRAATCLARIWKAGGLGGLDPPSGPSETWKQLGFQGTDPLTDVRGARVSGLVFMARFLEERSAAARSVLGGDAGGGFPFAIACLNVLFLLECHLRLGAGAGGRPPSYCPCCGVGVRDEYGPAQPYRGAHIRGFAALLVGDPDALFDVFAAAVLLCERLWAAAGDEAERHVANPLSMSAPRPEAVDLRLLQFPSMLRATKDAVLRSLAGTPSSLGALASAVAGSFAVARQQQQQRQQGQMARR